MESISGDGPADPEGPVKTGPRVALLWEHLSALLQLRLRQAQGDARTAARRLLMGVVFGVVALVLFLLTLPLLVTTVILALTTVLPAWLAAFVVLVAVLLIVAGLLLIARARLRWRGISLIGDLRADWQAIRRKVEEGR